MKYGMPTIKPMMTSAAAIAMMILRRLSLPAGVCCATDLCARQFEFRQAERADGRAQVVEQFDELALFFRAEAADYLLGDAVEARREPCHELFALLGQLRQHLAPVAGIIRALHDSVPDQAIDEDGDVRARDHEVVAQLRQRQRVR